MFEKPWRDEQGEGQQQERQQPAGEREEGRGRLSSDFARRRSHALGVLYHRRPRGPPRVWDTEATRS